VVVVFSAVFMFVIMRVSMGVTPSHNLCDTSAKARHLSQKAFRSRVIWH
jgi:hypothetical protein